VDVIVFIQSGIMFQSKCELKRPNRIRLFPCFYSPVGPFMHLWMSRQCRRSRGKLPKSRPCPDLG